MYIVYAVLDFISELRDTKFNLFVSLKANNCWKINDCLLFFYSTILFPDYRATQLENAIIKKLYPNKKKTMNEPWYRISHSLDP